MFVFTLSQDHRGYVWAGTYDGLNRFNGSSVTSYGIGANGKDQLSGNLIERIHEEKDGILWIHTNLGFDRFDVQTLGHRYVVEVLHHGHGLSHPEFLGRQTGQDIGLRIAR